MQTLYELTDELLAIYEMAQDEDIDPEAIEGSLEAIQWEFDKKVEGCGMLVKELEGGSNSLANEIKRLQARKKAYDNSIERIKKYVESAMRATGNTKIKTNLFSFGIQKNPPSVVIDDEKNIPVEYLIIKQEANKSAIKDALKAGEQFEWAHMEQTEGLRIRQE